MVELPTITASAQDGWKTVECVDAAEPGAELPASGAFAFSRGKNSRAGQATDQLFLAVFLLLMAFFAVMVAVSDFEENRTAAVMGSLRHVFGQTSVTLLPHGAGSSLTLGALNGDARQRLTGSLHRMAALKRLELKTSPDHIVFSFTPSGLFEEPQPLIRPELNVLFVRLSELLNLPGSFWDLRISVLSGAPLDGRQSALIASRLDHLSIALRDAGIDLQRLELALSRSAETQFKFELTQSGNGLGDEG